MSKLLRANFARLWKNKIFWLCMGGMLIYAAMYMLYSGQKTFSPATGEVYTIEHYYFQFLLYIGFFFAVVTSMFLGTEYSNGTMRNKLLLGHTRANVYLANLFVTFAAGLLIMCVWFIGALTGVPALGFFTFSLSELAVYFLMCVLLVAAYSAINTFIAMLSSTKTYGILFSILVFIGLLLCASILHNALYEPETVISTVVMINGVPSPGEEMSNPRYISEPLRSFFNLIMDILPTGQGANLAFLSPERPCAMILSSIAITVGMTVLGIVLFRKKDIK